MTSTPPRSPVPASATGPDEPSAGADRFLALVDHARAAVQAALAADAAARAHHADAGAGAGQTVSSEDADDTADAEDPAVRPTQLEEAVSALLSGPEAATVTIQVIC